MKEDAAKSCSDSPKHGNKLGGLSLPVEMGMKKLSLSLVFKEGAELHLLASGPTTGILGRGKWEGR